MTSEPVRLYIYGLLAPLAAVLVWYGVVEDEAVALWIALAEAVLGVGATEVTRSRVTPVADPRDNEGHRLTK